MTRDIAGGFKVERSHPHSEKCEDFKNALRLRHIGIFDGELQLIGRPPREAGIGNILTGEKYDPEDFFLNMVFNFCPFCGEKLVSSFHHTPRV